MNRNLRPGASVVLNVILTAALLVLVHHKSQPRTPESVGKAGREPGLHLGAVTHQAPAFADQAGEKPPPDISSATDRRRWVIDRLRAAGVPNHILAQVASSDIAVNWETYFWAESRKGADAEKMSALQLEFDMGRDAAMRTALGEAGFRQWDQEHMLQEANTGRIPLSASEADAIYDLKKKMQSHELALEQARAKGEMDNAAIEEASYAAYCQLHQQMKDLLGEERYAKSQQLEAEIAAANLRQDLARVNPTDSQFQNLLTAQQQWNERRSELDKQFQDDQGAAAYVDQIKALDQARDQEYERVLGTKAFDTLQKERDTSYSQMKKYEKIWGLDDKKIDYVYGTLRYYEESVQEYQAQNRALQTQGQNVDEEAVSKNLHQFAEQTQQALQNYLGQERFEKMRRNDVFRFNQAQSPRRESQQ